MNIRETYPFSVILVSLQHGESRAIQAGELAKRINVDTRTLRSFIEILRGDGVCICSSGKGYFYPSEKSEAVRWKMHMIGVRDKYDALAKSADKYLSEVS